MLKWTVSRSLSTNSARNQVDGSSVLRTTRRPFCDLSNTPPSSRSSTSNFTRSKRSKKRSKTHLRHYFQVAREISNEVDEKQGKIDVDADFPRNNGKSTPVGKIGRNLTGFHENLMNEVRDNFQSHVSDFFQQISLAGSPEDLIDTEYLEKTSTKSIFPKQNNKMILQNLLKSDQDKFENVDNTLIEILRKQEDQRVTNLKRKSLENEKDEENEEDISISSASQLLENPSPISWPFRSPSSDDEFTLKRQKVIRRKRQMKNQENHENSGKKRIKSRSLSPKTREQILRDNKPIEAVNLNVKKLKLETDLDSLMEVDPVEVDGKPNFWEIQSPKSEKKGNLDSPSKMEEKMDFWENESLKSSLNEDFSGLKSGTPLLETVRRCLKYSPDVENTKIISQGSIEVEYSFVGDNIHVNVLHCKDLRRSCGGLVHAYVKVTLRNVFNGKSIVKRTAVHKATPNPVFHETLVFPCPKLDINSPKPSLDIAVWHRDRRARRSELLGCMTLPLPLAQDKEPTWHPLEPIPPRSGSGCFSSSTGTTSPTIYKNGDQIMENNNPQDLTYLRHLELEPIDPATGFPINPGFSKGGRTPCTISRRLMRQGPSQVAWGFSLSWNKPPRVERVDPSSPAERAGLKPGDHLVFINTTNVVIKSREEILSLIQSATNQLLLEVYRKSHSQNQSQSQSQSQSQNKIERFSNNHQAVAVTFTTEVGSGVLV